MRRPVIARKATTQMTRNKAGIIGQQVYLSCARCNAKRARLPLLAGASANARQSGFATDGGVAMNNSALGRLIYRRNECVDIVRWRISFDRALTQSPNTTQDAAIAKSSALSLARTFGSGFGIGHAIKKLRAGASWMRSYLSTCQPRVRDQARPFRNHAVASDFFAGATDVFGASGVTVAFSAPGFDESTVKTAWVGAGAEATAALAERFAFGKWSGLICTIAPMDNCA